MTTPNSEPEKYAALSRHYIRMADAYLQAEDRVQASEKGWGAVAEAVKSIAAERGWHHQSHRLLNDAAYWLSEEWGREDLMLLYNTAGMLHINSFDDNMELDQIADSVNNAKTLLGELATLRLRPPRPPAVATRGQRNRWRRLTGQTLPIGADA